MKEYYSNTGIFFNQLKDLVRSATEIDVATYGAYLGISKGRDWQETFPLPAREFIDLASIPKKTRILVGYSAFTPQACANCQTYKDNVTNRHDSLLQAYKKLRLPIRTLENSHAKIYRIDNRVWVGSMNLGNSGSHELMIEAPINLRKHLKAYFDSLWFLGKELLI